MQICTNVRQGAQRRTHCPAMYQKTAKTKKTTKYTMKMPAMMYMSLVLRAEMKKSAAAQRVGLARYT